MNPRRATWLAIVLLVLQPLVWLWPCVFGGRTFVPYSTAEFPPASLQLPAEQVESARRAANHDITEPPVWFLPELRLAQRELAAGRLPLWNPHARTGAPIHAYAQLGLCYPPNWLLLLPGDPADRLVWLAWLGLTLAGLSTFGLLREVGLPHVAAWFGAATFQLSSPLAAHAYLWMHLASAAWAPGLLWAVLRLHHHPTLRPLPLAATALAFAMPWLAGFPPFAVTGTVLGVLLAAWLVIARALERGPRAAAPAAGRLLLGFGLGAMLAMPQVLPSLQFFPDSARSQNPSLDEIARSRFDPYALLGYVMPDAFGHPTTTRELPYGSSPLPLWLCDRCKPDGQGDLPMYNYTEHAVAFGGLGLLLAGLGALRGRGARRRFLLTALLLVFGLALFVPGIRLLYLLPAIQNVWPMRWLVHGGLLLAWLAALGLAALQDGGRRRPFGLAAAAALLAGACALGASWLRSWHAADPAALPRAIAQRVGVAEQVVRDHVQAGAPAGLDRFTAAIAQAAGAADTAALWAAGAAALLALFGFAARSRAAPWALATLLLLPLVERSLHGRTLLRGAERLPATTAVHTFLHEAAAAAADQGGFTIARASRHLRDPWLLPDSRFVPGLRDLHFYSHYDARSIEPLQRLFGPELGAQVAGKGYLTTTLPDAPLTAGGRSLLEHPLLDLLGVRYLLGTEPLDHGGPRRGPIVRGAAGGEFFVHERPNALGRAFVVPELAALDSDDDVLAKLVDPAFAPRERAFTTRSELADPPLRRGSAGERTVRFAADQPTHVDLHVTAGEAPWLVLTDTYLAGWTATVDGAPARIVRGNHSQRLVRLPPTACRVQFHYESPGLATGFLLAGIATLALAVSCLRTVRAIARPGAASSLPG